MADEFNFLWSPKFLTNFRAPFFKEIPFFFCGVNPSKTLAAPEPLNIAFPLGNGGVLRSEEGGGIQEGRGRWGGGKKKEKRTRKKCSDSELHCRGRCRCYSCPRPIRSTWWMQIWCLAVSMLRCPICRRSNCRDRGMRMTVQMFQKIEQQPLPPLGWYTCLGISGALSDFMYFCNGSAHTKHPDNPYPLN